MLPTICDIFYAYFIVPIVCLLRNYHTIDTPSPIYLAEWRFTLRRNKLAPEAGLAPALNSLTGCHATLTLLWNEIGSYGWT